MKRATAVLIGVFLLVLPACGRPPASEALNQQICLDLFQLEQAVIGLTEVTASTSVREVEEMKGEIERAYRNLEISAQAQDIPGIRRIDRAYRQLDSVLDSLPNATTLGDTASTVQGAAVTLITEEQWLFDNLNCRI